MSDFLDLVLARSYDAIPGAVRPRPVARFELPDSLPPVSEALPNAAPPDPAPAATAAAAPDISPAPPMPPIVARERITTRDLLTIRETTTRPAPVTAEPPATPVPAERRQTPNITINQSTSSSKAERGDPVAPIEAHVRPAALAPPTTPQLAGPPIAPLMPQPHAEPPPAARPIAPVVHVRIGRVELHGPAPAASPPRPPALRSAPAPVRPVRSLDDYLRRRNEER